ncbi:MAG: tyrosine-protein phosphatase [Bacteroidaceae bacterium]|nr:tyrosine-protein phosphatase [Bacteroidaceae bacterium]
MKNYQYILLLSSALITPQVAHSQRAIAFEGIENARDMGGLVMHDGQTLRTGMLIRSGSLAKATDSDVAVLKEKYRLTNVFDFRFEAEANTAPDRIIDGVSYTHLSTLPKALLEAFAANSPDKADTETTDMAAVLLKYALDPKVQTMARQLYPAIVTDSTAQRRYGAFLRGVLAAEGGVLWHCSQGKDRAGWASAFLLAALGADRATIVEDFDLSNASYARAVEAMSAKVREMGGGDEAVAFIRAIVGVSRENFVAALDLIEQRYGSLAGYIEHQLGFSKAEQQQLRTKYLITQQDGSTENQPG